ncbi:MAG: 7-carboxy-7-deazaguanine synthase QueE [Phycisphaerae bacterium]|nr:7-carboxy-7-deazaguanine synthase QueE [Phycisphaerae bacterium]
MNNTEIKITELFYSIQGEGLLAGRPCAFIRLAGCPLRCRFCDTAYSLDTNAGEKISIQKIIERLKDFKASYAVITGGEPMISPHLSRLCEKIKELNCHITVETSGIKYAPTLGCDLMSISPKLSNAYENKVDENKYLKIDELQKLIDNYNYQLKFVIDKKDDIAEVLQVLKELKNIDRKKILLMPQAKTASEYISKSRLVAELCKENNFIFSPRLQLLFGETKPQNLHNTGKTPLK